MRGTEGITAEKVYKKYGGIGMAKNKKGGIRPMDWIIAAAIIGIGVIAAIAFGKNIIWNREVETFAFIGALFGVLGILGVVFTIRYMEKGLREDRNEDEKDEKPVKAQSAKKSNMIFAVIVIGFVLVLTATSERWDPISLSDEIRFDTYESFAEFMARPMPYESIAADMAEEKSPEQNEFVYYDNQGNEITEEEFYRRELRLSSGKVVCEYVARNKTVVHVQYEEKNESLLPIEVVTEDGLALGAAKSNARNMGIYGSYCVGIAFVYLFLQREKQTD